MNICSIDGCESPVCGNGYCGKHYHRFRKHGANITLLPRLDKSVGCMIDGCDMPVRKRGMCNSHYTQWWRNEHPEKATRTKRAAWERRSARRRSASVAGTHSLEEWESLLVEHQGKCFYCSNPAESRDHVIPISRGGSDSISNIVPACLRCNKRKGALTADEFLERLAHEADSSTRTRRA